MAEGIRISQLPTVTVMTDDDTLIVNDGNAATSRISYANFKTSISGAITGVTSVNGLTGDVSIDATSLGVYTIQQVNDLLVTKASNALIGVVNGAVDLGSFSGDVIPDNVTVRGALQALEAAIESGDAQDAILNGDNTFTGTNNFQGTITAGMNGNVIPFYFDGQANFPSASAAHGAIAHSHEDGKMYFAHGGAWVELANAGGAGSIDPADYYTSAEVDQALAGKLDTTGGSVSGLLSAGAGVSVTGVTASGAALNVDGAVYISSGKVGTDLLGSPIPFIASSDEDIATKKYVDDAISSGGVDLSGYYTSAEVDATFAGYSTTLESDAAYATAAQGTLADTALQAADLTAYSTTAEADLLYATAAQGALAESALQDGSLYATATQGATADTALQPGAIGVTVQAYDANTVVDASYATVQSGAAAGATALQAETIDMTAFKAVVAASSDFADFQTRVAAL